MDRSSPFPKLPTYTILRGIEFLFFRRYCRMVDKVGDMFGMGLIKCVKYLGRDGFKNGDAKVVGKFLLIQL